MVMPLSLRACPKTSIELCRLLRRTPAPLHSTMPSKSATTGIPGSHGENAALRSRGPAMGRACRLRRRHAPPAVKDRPIATLLCVGHEPSALARHSTPHGSWVKIPRISAVVDVTSTLQDRCRCRRRCPSTDYEGADAGVADDDDDGGRVARRPQPAETRTTRRRSTMVGGWEGEDQ